MNCIFNPFDNQYWIPRGSNKLLTYIGPPFKENLAINMVRPFLKQKKAWGAIWNYDSDYSTQGPWYRSICDTPDYNIDLITSKSTRHNIRRGLSRSEIRRVDYQWLVENAYGVYLQATTRYTNPHIESESDFKRNLAKHHPSQNMEAWGVFADGKLIAYMTLYIYPETVMGDKAAFDPDYSSLYPMYVFFLYRRPSLFK